MGASATCKFSYRQRVLGVRVSAVTNIHIRLESSDTHPELRFLEFCGVWAQVIFMPRLGEAMTRIETVWALSSFLALSSLVAFLGVGRDSRVI
jgi:hypothetical protein